MKKIRTIGLILCLILLLQPVLAVSGTEVGTASCRTVDATAPLGGSEKLVSTSTAVFVYERKSGTVVYAYNPDERIYPSSMVKLMTAIVALENGNLDDICVVTRAALESVGIGTVSAGLERWEEISLRDLLYCMMVPSANDAAAVIAEHIAGSQEAFCQLMNEKAAELGCADTHFSNATGLHDDDTYTTARDICKIINAGLEIPEFEEMFKATNYTVPATNLNEERNLVTTNYMTSTESTSEYYRKYYDERVTGGKTGATDKAGRCLAVTAEIGGMELVAIVMGAKPTYAVEGLVLSRFGSFEEMGEVLDYVEENFEYRQIFQENQVISQNTVSGGSNDVTTAPGETIYCVLPKEMDPEQLTWSCGTELNSLAAPIAKGQVLSSLQVWYSGNCVAEADLIAMNSVNTVSLQPESRQDNENVQEETHGELIAAILAVVLGIVVVIAVIMVVIRAAQRAAAKARIRRRRRNRRRNRNA